MNEERVATAAVLLSMDIVRPLYYLIGLREVDNLQFQENLRLGLREAKRVVASAISSPSSAQHSPLSKILDSSLTQLNGSTFRNWVDKCYREDPAEDRALLVWRGIVDTVSVQIHRDCAGFSPSLRASLISFCEILMLPTNFDDLWKSLVNSPMSAWDVTLLAQGVWDDEETFGLDALYFRLHTIYLAVHEYSCWTTFLGGLSTVQIQELHATGKNIGELIGYETSLICSPLALIHGEK